MSKKNETVKFSVPQRSVSKKKLGKGLGALMGEVQREEPLVQAPTGGTPTVSAPIASAAASGDSGSAHQVIGHMLCR